MDTAEHARGRAAWWFTCGLFFVLSLLTTVPWLHHVGGWLDEGATMSAARRSIADLVTLCTHHDAVLGVPRGAAHGASIVHGELDPQLVIVVVLPGVNRETHPVVSVALELLDVVGVQGGGLRSGVDFRLYVRHADIGQAYPFTPPGESA